MTTTTAPLFDVTNESAETFNARVIRAAQKAIGRMDASVGRDLDRIEQALRTGGTFTEMKALVAAHESLVTVHQMLRKASEEVADEH